MRIGIFDPYLDDLGGGEKYILTLSECLSRKHDVELFWDKQSDLDIVTERFSIDLSKVKIVKNIFAKNFGLFNRLVASKKYDAIIVLSDGSIPLIATKLFLHIQQPIVGLSYSLKDQLKISRVNRVFCNSKFTENFLEKRLRDKSLIIYPPIHLKPKKVEKENIILTVGRFRVKNVGVADYKKQSVLVDAFIKMVDEGLSDWKFVLATSVRENEEEEFEKLKMKTRSASHSTASSDRVGSGQAYPIEFLVNKKNDDLWDIYSRAKIYWHATGYGEDLKSRPDFAEHFGISTVEAMGAGAVPVVIKAGGQIEIIENGVSGYLWDNLDELANKTRELIENPEKLEKMSNESVIAAKKIANMDFCREIQKLISNV